MLINIGECFEGIGFSHPLDIGSAVLHDTNKNGLREFRIFDNNTRNKKTNLYETDK